ncbi:MAG: molybdenum ABC transporter ATP-binding protein [Thermodesulfobacteriota bacterium]|nr:molybdenum ABC transporter ATP-binding protein [Thermodesulfobacteriota bacterium]
MSIAARFKICRGTFSLDVDMEIPGRGVTAVFGPSGCGKTTLLRAIAGLEPGIRGTLTVGGKTWQDSKSFLLPHKRPVGYVFQEPSLFGHLTVKQNIEYGRRRVPRTERRISVDRAVSLLGIGHLLGRRPHQLSGGEQQRVAIARALAVSPALLLLDEPLAALDMDKKKEIMPYLESLHRQLAMPVLYVSHSRDEVARLGDHMVLMDAGKILAAGPVREIFSRIDLALAHGPDAETIIEATVGGHDPEFALTYLDCPAGRFTVAGNKMPTGNTVRIQIAANDVSILLSRQSGTSILNIFPARVDRIAPATKALTTVRLMVGEMPLLARITRKSAVDLGLEPGKQVYAQIKAAGTL